MSTTPNTTDNVKPEHAEPATLAEALEAVKALRKSLEAERTEHRATKVKSKLSAADEEALEKFAAARVAAAKAESDTALSAAAKERDEARAAADQVRNERAAERIEAALSDAFAKSGASEQHKADFMLMAKPLFTVGKDGQIVTREDAADTLPGVDPAAYIHGQVKATRAHWWGVSTGGGARGGTHAAPGGNTKCFDPRSPEFNVTAQGQYFKRYGPEATRRAERMYGGGH